MNPPYTDIKRRIRGVLGKFEHAFDPAQNYWAYFLALADSLIGRKGRIAAVLPRLFLFGADSRAVRRWLVETGYHFRFLVRSCKETAFTEDARFRDYLVVLEKPGRAATNSKCAVVYVKKTLDMPLEHAAELGEMVSERASQMRGRAKFAPVETQDYSLKWVTNEDIRRDIVNGNDSLLWKSVCWEKVSNGETLNAFYDAMAQLGLVPLDTLFRGKKRWVIRGMEPKPQSMYKSAFIVRPTVRARISRAVLIHGGETKRTVSVQAFSTSYGVPRKALVPGLRSISHIDRIFIGKVSDWVIVEHFASYDSKLKKMLQPRLDFTYLRKQREIRGSCLALAKRINFSAPGTCAVSFFSQEPMLTSNQLYQIRADGELARHLALWLNSTLVLVHLLLHRSETEGSFSDILLGQIPSIPVPTVSLLNGQTEKWTRIESQFGESRLPSLMEQFRRPQSFRREFDKALISLLDLSKTQETMILERLSSAYAALADELATVSASMRGAEPAEDSDAALFPDEEE